MQASTWKDKRFQTPKSHINLEAVYFYVKNYEYPPGTSDLDKRSIRKRAKSFTFIDNHFVYLPEKAQKVLDDGTEITIEPRRVLLKEEKQRKAVWAAHVDERGNHLGMEKTTYAVSKTYYWLGISSLVRDIIRGCAVCRASRAACSTAISTPILTSEIKSEVDAGTAPDEFESFMPCHSMRVETATSFWQKVELQVLGPYSQGKTKLFVVICLDRYSLWTEGAVIPAISSATVTHVILNLICRFGSMQTLLLRENERANRDTVEIREDLFEKAGLDIRLTVDNSPETGAMWRSIEDQVRRFTDDHPTCWSQCLDLCLLPLRISRPDTVEYTPDFLVYNREIPLPSSLSHRPENFDMELHLNPEQMSQTTEVLMNIYNGFCLSFPYYIPKLTLARKVPDNSVAAPKTNIVICGTPATSTGSAVTSDVSSTSSVSDTASSSFTSTSALISSPTASVSAPTTGTTATPVVVPTPTATTSVTTETTSPTTVVAATTAEDTSTEIKIVTETTSDKTKAGSPHVKSVISPACEKTESGGKDQTKDKRSSIEESSPRKIITRSGRVSIPTPGMLSLMSKGRHLGAKESRKKDASKRSEHATTATADSIAAAAIAVATAVAPEQEEEDEEEEEEEYDDIPDDEYVPPSKRTRSGKSPRDKKSPVTRGSKKSASDVSRRLTIKSDTDSQASFFDSIDKMEDLDTYYAALKQYIKLGTYNTGTTVHQKRVIRKISKNYVVEDDVMYYIQESKGKATKKMVVMTMSERIDLLRAAHVLDDGSHVSKQKIVETLDRQNKYWKGLTLDAYAFTRACRTCEHGRERLRDYSYLRDGEESEEEEEMDGDLMEEDGQESNFEDLVTFMKHHRYPKDSTPNQKSTIRKQSKKFIFIDDELYYVYGQPADASPRKVIFKEAERQAVIKEAHSANHWGINRTMVNAREKGYWSGMTADCYNYLKKCKHCSRRLLTMSMHEEIKKKKMRLEDRVRKFREMFVAKIAEMDKNADKSTSVVSVKVEKDSFDQSGTSEGQKQNTNEKTQSEQQASDEHTQLPAEHVAPSCDQVAPSSGQLAPSSGQTTASDNPVQDNVEHTYSVIQRSESGTLTLSMDAHTSGDQAESSGSQLVTSVTNQSETSNSKHTAVDSTSDLVVETDSGQFVIENDYVTLVPAGTHEDGQPMKLEDGVEITVTYDNGNFVQTNTDDESRGTASRQLQMLVHRSVLDQQEKTGRKISRKQKFKCDYCGKVIKGTMSFKYHIFKHTGVKPYQCEFCPKTFTNSKSCRLHMRKHTGETPFLCNLCGRAFCRAASLQYHLRAHSTGGGVPVQCSVCKREFSTALRLRKHMECKHPKQPPIYHCLQCNKYFTAARSLKRHQASHQGVRHYQCQICSRSFFRKEYLNSHMLQHPEAGSLPVTSKPKSQRRKTQPAPNYETQGVQLSEQSEQFPCHYCSQVFYRKDFLNTHLMQHPEARSIVIITADGQTKKAEMTLSYDGQGFGNEGQSGVGHRDMQELQRQQAEEAAQEQAIQSIVQIDSAPPPESTAYVLSQDAVEYEVECLTSESLTEADLKAIQILTQASLQGTL